MSSFIPTPIPDLHSQWETIDLRSLIVGKQNHTAPASAPFAVFVISMSNSLLHPDGVQAGEKQWLRSTTANIRSIITSARAAGGHIVWVGYDVIRVPGRPVQTFSHTLNELDKAQYGKWSTPQAHLSEEQKQWDATISPELSDLKQSHDLEIFETAHQSSFVGTVLPLHLTKWGVKTLVLTGLHLDWCIEGNARAARDHGYNAVVIGDAAACQLQSDEPAALRRINTFFAPVISTQQFVQLVAHHTKQVQKQQEQQPQIVQA